MIFGGDGVGYSIRVYSEPEIILSSFGIVLILFYFLLFLLFFGGNATGTPLHPHKSVAVAFGVYAGHILAG